MAAVVLSGDSLGAHGRGPMTEVVVTLRAPSLSAFGRSLQSSSHHIYMRQVDSAQTALSTRITSMLPDAQVRWQYHLVADGMAVYLPRSQAAMLAKIPGVARVWPNVRFHALRDTATAAASVAGPKQIGADKLWGPNFTTAGNGMKIGIIDDGLQASHTVLQSERLPVPARLPEGADGVHDTEGDRAAHICAAVSEVEVRQRPVRPRELLPRDPCRGNRRR